MRGIPSDFRMKKGDLLSIKISDSFPFINFSLLISLVYVFLSKNRQNVLQKYDRTSYRYIFGFLYVLLSVFSTHNKPILKPIFSRKWEI